MKLRERPGEIVAANDAVFEQLATEPEREVIVLDPDVAPEPMDTLPNLSGEVGHPPVGDYVRELKEEFEEQEAEVTFQAPGL